MRRRSSESGSALVELAVVLPLLVVLLLGTMDFGRAFYLALMVSHAARVGAEYGAQSNIKSLDTTGMQNAATAAGADLTGFTATAYAAGSAQNPCKCWNGTTESSMATCASTCTGSVRVYTRVDGSATFTTAVNYPGMVHTITITRSVWMRAQ